jgi:hypothetical protein
MTTFVFATGLCNVFAGLLVLMPGGLPLIMPAVDRGLPLTLFGLVVVFLGIMLILCSRDLRARGSLVAWEGVLRVVGGCVLMWYGIEREMGPAVTLAGVGDLLIGMVYLVALPRHVGVGLLSLLRDRMIGAIAAAHSR